MTGNALLDLLLIAIPALFIRLWWTGSRAHELAVEHARKACVQRRLQLLDQTAGLKRAKLRRDNRGSYCLEREYRFEFTDEGHFRDSASVTLQGHRLKEINFPYFRDADGNRIYLQ